MASGGESELSTRRLSAIRLVGASFAIPSFVLGGWMVLDPAGFWDAIGLGGGEPIVQAIYGGAIVGEGAMLAMCAWRPRRYMLILQYMVVYKAMACTGAALALSHYEPPPTGALLVIAGWAFAGVVAALVFPWRASLRA